MGWRVAALIAGLAIYWAMVRLAQSLAETIGSGSSGRIRFLVPYGAGALMLVACAAIRWDDGSALEAAKVGGLASVGYVWAVARARMPHSPDAQVERSRAWIVIGVTAVILYSALFGPGIGRLA